MEHSQMIDPRVYYQSMRKRDKARFLRYLTGRYGYSSGTMSGKLRENNVSELRRDEMENLLKTIKSGAWKR